MFDLARTLLWSLVQTQPYLALFPLMLLEGPIATITAGTLVAAGLMTFPLAGLAAVAADLLADTACYLIGRSVRFPRVARLLPRLGLTEDRRLPLEQAVRRNLPVVLLGAKVADAAAIPVLLAAGAAGVGYLRFLAWNVAITIPKALLLVGVGALFGAQLARFLDKTGMALAALAGLTLYLLVTGVLRRARTPRPATT